MEEFNRIEETVLESIVEAGGEARIIFTTGYQAAAKILDFDSEAILAEVKGKRWLIYRHAVSTIEI